MTRLLKNSATLVVGRIALSAMRMIAALIVARLAGAEDFGAYVLLISLIALAEWLVDFGQTDMAVRDAARRAGRQVAVLAALARAKRVQGPAVALLLPLGLWLAGQDRAILLAGCAGSVAVLATAAMQPARAALRLALRMDRDIGAELAGVALMLPLLAIACLYRAPLSLLIGSFALARLAQALLVTHWAGPLKQAQGRFPITRLVHRALPLGCAGLLVLLYDALAPLLLAHLLDMRAVALYAAAARFIMPVLVAVQAVASAAFPLIARDWRRDPAAFARTQQGTLLLSVALAALMFAGIHGGAGFLMGLMGPDFVAGAPLLQLMAWTLLARAITTAMSPLIVVAGRQGRAMLLTMLSLAGQCAALFLLVPVMGVIGAAWACLLVELLLGTIAVSWIAQHVTGLTIDWRSVAALIGSAVVAALLVGASPLAGSLMGGAAAAAIVLAFMALSMPRWRHFAGGLA
ncbi:oligosaccharide flippase family protein [Sphingobium sp. WCS2017Hpa-17]|uniref:lipopolysaccharide biosynthesis protein n=1 Tax=Sphingobium sp. WCS2017Hpa-17 TaxID=3073638 RepID=UPI002889C655|nr:oligosaccharide flippase family protein [Sphingobium sp. WCS2017Hpa-17]